MRIDTPIENIYFISKRIISPLRRLGIHTLQDLLYHFPSRYEKFPERMPIAEVSLNETATVQGVVKKIINKKTFRRRMFITKAVIEDESGSIQAVWFNQPFIARNIPVGSAVQLSGKVVLGDEGLSFQSPTYEKISGRAKEISASKIHTGGLVPIYPETQGITSRWLRYLIHSLLPCADEAKDPIPEEILQRYNLPVLSDALHSIHFPKNEEEAARAKQRFIFENLFLLQLKALQERIRIKQFSAPVIKLDVELLRRFARSLPFKLTAAQKRSIWEIAQDLSKGRPMNRLLEGDVGSGKTVVASAAALLCAHSGYQTAFMTPTEILARQHFNTLKSILSDFNLKMGILTASEKDIPKDVQVVVGTHALIQGKIRFEKLGLVVVDEQHRFGVQQRAKLVQDVSLGCDKNNFLPEKVKDDFNPVSHKKNKQDKNFFLPHFLSMSATPIPRTLALAFYGNLDLSILDQMPKGRKKIITKIISPQKRTAAYEFIRKEVKAGRQVFVVCPRIDAEGISQEKNNKTLQQKIDFAQAKAVIQEHKKLAEEIFPDLKVGMLHGRMKSAQKEKVMKDFKEGLLNILVSTSVIEVGVDVPNATIMMIEGAERFGLAQLHQFRGRVGRGAKQSYCLLFTTDGSETKRLRALVESQDGFEIAKKDLEIRGPGDIFGTRQWGVPNVVLKEITDAKLIHSVRKEAIALVKADPTLRLHPELGRKIEYMEKVLHQE